ncbi:MAG: hypothetical protein K2K22_05870, partial [Muribaculaceae bacterium]|nr:hypothetical protein [Muribaculaceae bacterium]
MRRIAINIVFTISMILMAAILTGSACLLCVVNVLRPEYLTPLVESLADKTLDADVSIGRIELAFRPSLPVLGVEVDSLVVLSEAFSDVSEESRAALPQWADTLLVVDRFSGAVDLWRLLSKGEVALRDVELVRPGVNIVLDRDGRGNFDIYQAAEAADTTENDGPMVVPPVSINHFAFVEPREIRYFNAVDSTEATILLLRDVRLDNVDEPLYRLSVDGHITSPLTKAAINLEDISFGVDGRVRWTPRQPMRVAFEGFSLYGAFIKAKFDGAVALDSTLAIPKASVHVGPVAISDMLSVLPDSLRRAHRLIAPYFSTDGAVSLEAELTRTFVPARDTIPYARVSVSMPDCRLVYGKADFRQLAFDISADLNGPDLDSAYVTVSRLELAGPATHLN